jgi:hypothetical protein
MVSHSFDGNGGTTGDRRSVRCRRFRFVLGLTLLVVFLTPASAVASGTSVYANWVTHGQWGGRAPLYQNQGQGWYCSTSFVDGCGPAGSCIGESETQGGSWYHGYTCSSDGNVVNHYYNGTVWLHPFVGGEWGAYYGFPYWIWGWEYWK